MMHIYEAWARELTKTLYYFKGDVAIICELLIKVQGVKVIWALFVSYLVTLTYFQIKHACLNSGIKRTQFGLSKPCYISINGNSSNIINVFALVGRISHYYS